ncbi:MAG: hypothetical protein ACKON9_30070, partial [Planctomycetaceae bacterium]
PLPAASVVFPGTVVAASVNAVFVVVTLPLSVVEPAVWTSPPVNVSVSLPFPSATAPEVPKVTAFVTVVLVPCRFSAKLPPVFVIAVA